MSATTPVRYRRTAKAFSGRGQQALVVECFESQPGATVKEVVTFLEQHPRFSTVQTAERIAAYYICVLKKSGHIEEALSELAELEAQGQMRLIE